MVKTIEIQTRLKAHGFDPGPLDGIFGRKTIATVEAFQRAKNLSINNYGTVGPKTLAALGFLFEEIEEEIVPPWVIEARRYFGMHELRNKSKLIRALRLDPTEIPWCGAFMGLVIATTLPKEVLPPNQLWARDWLKFGYSIEEPYLGAVAVFSRPGGGGHVGEIVGHEDKYLHILGGNQSNMVRIDKIIKTRLLGIRWPHTYALRSKPLKFSTISATVSHNEA